MRRNWVIVIVLATVMAGDAIASQWVVIVQNQSASQELDLDSISPAGSPIQKAWVRERKGGVMGYVNGVPVRGVKKLFLYDCKASRQKQESQVLYGDESFTEFISQEPAPPSTANWFDVPPDSLGEAQMKLVCKNSP